MLSKGLSALKVDRELVVITEELFVFSFFFENKGERVQKKKSFLKILLVIVFHTLS